MRATPAPARTASRIMTSDERRNTGSISISIGPVGAIAAELPAALSGLEANIATFMPKWPAYEMRLMAERFVSDVMIPQGGDRERLENLLGRPLHSYRETDVRIAAA
ncbi:hypothetical protein SAMN05518668_1173 [Sphingobium sp. YR657]|nr:hypothetical protein SAMN05518668_1173 [Sphingobium sp. YR657]